MNESYVRWKVAGVRKRKEKPEQERGGGDEKKKRTERRERNEDLEKKRRTLLTDTPLRGTYELNRAITAEGDKKQWK
jgi:hypothetical protein